MAIYPCDYSSHRYREAQQSVYVTILDSLGAQTHKLRLCPTHFEQTFANVQSTFKLVDDDIKMPTQCELCGKGRDESLFVKLYRLHQEPEQFCLETCGPCGSRLTNELRIANGRPL